MTRVDGIRAVVTDIEGTTTSLAFVRERLFPYARSGLSAYVRDHEAELAAVLKEIGSVAGRPNPGVNEVIEIVLQWMDEDRKVTPLKTLQGLIWRAGYASGQLQGHVYDDAVRALRKWHARGIGIYIYSSGSIEAQQLLFSHTQHGNLTPLISGYFDTTTGPKLDPDSYRSIARALSLAPRSIVFLSDHSGETRAAAEADLQSILLARDPAKAEPPARSFDDIMLNG